VVPIKTSQPETGRADARPRIESGGDKARFVREIERALLDGEVDLGVHSAKDLPTDLPEDLEIAGVPEREDPRDAYVGHVDSLGEVPAGSRIGTSSLRRRAQILARRPDLEVVELRGNVDTRLVRYEAGDFDGIVLAAAGLNRLGRAEEIAFAIEPDECVPAPGQGAIVIESRRSDEPCHHRSRGDHRPRRARPAVGRALRSPPSTQAATRRSARTRVREHGGRMRLRAFCGLPDGSGAAVTKLGGDASGPGDLGAASQSG
jgi:hydroxymethylbilane synthase